MVQFCLFFATSAQSWNHRSSRIAKDRAW